MKLVDPPRFLVAVLLILILTASSSRLTADEPESLESVFRAAPARLPGDDLPLAGLPLWHTNGELTSELIREIFEGGQKNGFGGITFLPLGRTTPRYLSEEYMKLYGEALDTADKLDMKVVFYDDVDFPSGSAGGELKEKFPEATAKRLDKAEWIAEGPTEFVEKSPIPFVERPLFGSPGGILQAAVAQNLQTNERVDLSKNVAGDEIRWNVPQGRWRIMLFVCVADSNPTGLVDNMSPEAMTKFMSLTYDRFAKRFPEHFGTTIPLVFFDDVTIRSAEGYRNWTPGFNDKYRELFGREPWSDYPALFYPIGDETPAARWRLWTTRNELFADGYPKSVAAWCAKHKVRASGHPQGPYVIEPLDMCGDAMLTHRWSDAVLFDSIHYYGHGRDGFKVPTSAAFNFDHPVCVVEIYGNYRDETFDDQMMYRSAMEIFARGGNMLLPHGIWSDPATVYIPPEISWRNPKLNGCLPEYDRFVGRCSLLLRGGRHVADWGMLYPIDAMKAYYHFMFGSVTKDYPTGLYLPEETDYLAIGSDLTSRIYRDFTILHPTTLDAKCSIERSSESGRGDVPVLRLNNEVNREEYEVVVLTGADVISGSNMRTILDFWRNGGKVLATTRLPSRSAEGTFDDEIVVAIEEIFGIDPRTQAVTEAIRTGQEDIVLPESFREARELNREGQYRRPIENPIVYSDPIERPRAIFLPRPTTEALRAAVETLLPVPDVAILPNGDKPLPTLTVTPRWIYPHQGMVQYIHKQKEGRDVYYFANSSDEAVSFEARLRGEFKTLEFWNPNDGEITSIPENESSEQNGVTSVQIELPAIKSVFVVGERR